MAPVYKTAELPDGIKLAYVDSGSKGQDQRLIVALHGVGFNATCWTPIFEHLKDITRFVAYNQRSYEGSSPAAANEGAMRAYLDDLLNFLRYLIKSGDLTETGGLTLIGWSKGAVPLFALLGSPAGDSSFLEPYLRSVVLHEPPGSAFGLKPTPDLEIFINKMTPETMAECFEEWVVQYSDPNPALPASDPESLKKSVPHAWQPECVPHGYVWLLKHIDVEGEKALVEPEGYLARVPLGVLVGSNTVGYCKDSARKVQECFDKRAAGLAKTQVNVIPGVNHFAFVTRPANFVEQLERLVNDLET